MNPILVFFAIIVVSVYLITKCYHALRPVIEYDKVWKLLQRKSRWTKRSYARDKYGNLLELTNPNAYSWCIVGGLQKVYGSEGSANKYNHLYDFLGESPELFNDRSSHSQVLSVLKELDI